MDKIVNYTMESFYKKPAQIVREYIDYLAYLKPQETRREVFYLKLKEVQQIKDLMQQGRLDDLVELVGLVQDLEREDVMQIRVVEFFGLVRSIKDQIQVISNAESTNLTGQAYNQKWEAVDGSGRLAKFGIYNVLDKLANGDILKYDKILELSYADVFTKLFRDTVMADIEYEMGKIKSLIT